MSGVSTQEVSSQISQRRQREWVDWGGGLDWAAVKTSCVVVTREGAREVSELMGRAMACLFTEKGTCMCICI